VFLAGLYRAEREIAGKLCRHWLSGARPVR
jgi:hypothetical protein